MIISFDIYTLDGDLEFLNGDLVIRDSNAEHADAILDSCTGEWKQSPSTGANLIQYLNSPGQTSRLEIEQVIKKQYSDDGFSVTDLLVTYDLTTNNLVVKTNADRIR